MRYPLIQLISLSLLVLTACKKELELHANTDILQFSYIDNNGDEMQAPVYGDTIYVYWPPLQAAPTALTPTIIVHESSTIFPVSKAEITLTENPVYTVKAESGAVKSYHVRLITNQPYPLVKNVQNMSVANGLRYWVNTRQLIFVGDNFLFDGMTTKVWAQRADGSRIEVSIVSNTGARMALSAPPLGKYRIVFEVGERQLEYFYEIEVIEPFVIPAITPPATPLTVKRGESFELSGVLTEKITSVTMGDYSIQTPLEIVSARDDKVVLGVPDDFPVGSNIRVTYIYSGGQYFGAGTTSIYLSRAITITE